MPSPAALSDAPQLAACTEPALALLRRVEQPIWIYDLTFHRVVWANPPAVALWKADSLDELCTRNFDPAAPGTAERLANLRLRLARGETMIEQWVIYPRGEPIPLRCRFTGVLVPGGEVGMMVEVLPAETGGDAAGFELRAVEAVRHAPLMISLVTPHGRWLMHNPAAEALFNRLGRHVGAEVDGFASFFADPGAAKALRDTALRDGAAQAVLRVSGRLLRMHEVALRRLIDPATGDLSLIVSQQDVTRAFRLEQRLKRALLRERARAELQRQFLAVTSHDFRTPLSIIDGAARRIGKLAGPAAAVSEKADAIRRAVQRMTDSIDKTLATAMIADGKAAFRPESADLGAIVSAVTAAQRALHPDRAIALDLPALPALMLDPVLVERVVDNVIANAIKYSPPGAPVSIEATIADDAVTVAVVDRGIGIPAEDLPQLFTRYFRGSNARRIKGTGVGLHAARMIMDLHRGRIALSSREDEGTTVRITFPRPAG